MRVLHVIPSLSPDEGGPSHVLPLMVEGLTRRGHEVVTATTHGRDELSPAGHSAHHSFPRQSEFYKVSFPLAQWVAAEAKNFDLVHVHALFSFSSIESARLAGKSGTPYVIRPLGVLNEYGVRSRRRWLKRLSIMTREAPMIRKAAAMHFTSEAEKNEAERLGIPMNSQVIPLGIEIPDSLPNCEIGKSPSVLFLSRIDPKKNIESLIKGWSHLDPDIRRTWRLKIAGSGDPEYVRKLQGLCGQLGLTSRIDWCGFVKGEEKQQILSDSSIFILPSFSENFGIAAVEAMGAGIPSILTEGVAVGAEAAQANGCVLSNTDPESITSVLEQLMRSPEQRKVVAANGHAFARKHYSVSRMAEALESLYEGLV